MLKNCLIQRPETCQHTCDGWGTWEREGEDCRYGLCKVFKPFLDSNLNFSFQGSSTLLWNHWQTLTQWLWLSGTGLQSYSWGHVIIQKYYTFKITFILPFFSGHRHLGHWLHIRWASHQRTNLPLQVRSLIPSVLFNSFCPFELFIKSSNIQARGYKDQQPVSPRPTWQNLQRDGLPPGGIRRFNMRSNSCTSTLQEKDWEDMRRMPEHPTLLKVF